MTHKIVAEQILRELEIMYDAADLERVTEILRKNYEPNSDEVKTHTMTLTWLN
jgi:hypothetical protein